MLVLSPNSTSTAGSPGTKLYISIYMDDIVLFGLNCLQAVRLVEQLKTEFEVTDLGIANWLLGLQITYDDNGIHLS